MCIAKESSHVYLFHMQFQEVDVRVLLILGIYSTTLSVSMTLMESDMVSRIRSIYYYVYHDLKKLDKEATF